MKKYTLLYSAVVALALVSCDYNEDNFDGFEDFGKPTDIKKGNITFTDWASLKGNPKTNQYFSAADEAQDYLPNWLAGQYPSADEGSSFKSHLIIKRKNRRNMINTIISIIIN